MKFITVYIYSRSSYDRLSFSDKEERNIFLSEKKYKMRSRFFSSRQLVSGLVHANRQNYYYYAPSLALGACAAVYLHDETKGTGLRVFVLVQSQVQLGTYLIFMFLAKSNLFGDSKRGFFANISSKFFKSVELTLFLML